MRLKKQDDVFPALQVGLVAVMSTARQLRMCRIRRATVGAVCFALSFLFVWISCFNLSMTVRFIYVKCAQEQNNSIDFFLLSYIFLFFTCFITCFSAQDGFQWEWLGFVVYVFHLTFLLLSRRCTNIFTARNYPRLECIVR